MGHGYEVFTLRQLMPHTSCPLPVESTLLTAQRTRHSALGTRHYPSALPPYYHPILHHERHALHRGDVGQRVAGDGDDVGELLGLEGADAVGHVEEVGCGAGGGLDGLHGGHAELRLVSELLRLVDGLPGEAADVGAEG